MNKKRNILIFIVVAITCFIFFRSLRDAEMSTKESSSVVNVIEKIIKAVYVDAPETFSEMLVVIVRKAAHVAEFALQSISLCALFTTFSGKVRAHIPWILFLGLFTACFDEALQLSMSGRGSLVSDVFIDFGGTLLGIIIFFVFCAAYAHMRKRRLKV